MYLDQAMVGVGMPLVTLHWKIALPPITIEVLVSGYNSISGASRPNKENIRLYNTYQ